jgi:hypothetical protein
MVGTNSLISGGTRYDIVLVVNHPQHTPSTFANDIALLKTKSAITFNNLVGSIGVALSSLAADQPTVSVGWGLTSVSVNYVLVNNS